MYLKTTAIVLQNLPLREQDALIFLYTQNNGKFEAVAAGAKKINSKLNGHCQPLQVTEVMLAKGKSFWRVAGAKVKIDFFGIKNDLNKIAAAQFLLATANSLIKPEQPEKKIFLLLKKTLETLQENKNQEAVWPIVLAAIWKMAAWLGYQPTLNSCLKCRRPVKNQTVFFSPSRGGVVCSICRQAEIKEGDFLISWQVLEILRNFMEQPLAKISDLKIEAKIILKIIDLMQDYLQIHSESRINGLETIKKIIF